MCTPNSDILVFRMYFIRFGFVVLPKSAGILSEQAVQVQPSHQREQDISSFVLVIALEM